MSKSTYAYTKAWRARNPEKWHAYRRTYYLSHIPQERAMTRKNRLKRRSLLLTPLPRLDDYPDWILLPDSCVACDDKSDKAT